jgi:hypothetical protein
MKSQSAPFPSRSVYNKNNEKKNVPKLLRHKFFSNNYDFSRLIVIFPCRLKTTPTRCERTLKSIFLVVITVSLCFKSKIVFF